MTANARSRPRWKRRCSTPPGTGRGTTPARPPNSGCCRHYSLSDRIRYYWPAPRAAAAVDALTARLEGVTVPMPLMRQHLPGFVDLADALAVDTLLVQAVARSLETYHAACHPGGG
ncbi:MAG: class II D-tagatose-bisphosphate aldolase, non-catalytic subunit [Paracoccaceae bacterium]